MEDEKNKSNIPKPLTMYDKIKNQSAVLDTEDLEKVASFISNFDPKDDRYRRTLEAQGYVAARRSTIGSYKQIASSLGLPYNEFKYYLDTKPEFAAAIRKGIIDSKEEVKETLINKLVKKATGYITEDSEVTDTYAYNEDGFQIKVGTKIKKITKEVPPDAQAALELLKQLDPSWRPKAQVDVNVNVDSNINVTENRITQIDLAKLSPSALEEILISQKAEGRNVLANKREDGLSVNSLYIDQPVVEVQDRKRKPMSEETKEKLRRSHKKRQEVEEQKKKELEKGLIIEELNNGNKQ